MTIWGRRSKTARTQSSAVNKAAMLRKGQAIEPVDAVTRTLREVRVSRDRLALAAELVQSGELAVVELLESKRDQNGFRVTLRYRG